jgi:hypothetical protein
MKTIAPAAMEAIEAGEAIVTGAVEIVPREGIIPDIIATGTAVELTWQQNTFIQPGGNDEARMGLAYYDQAGVQIGSNNWSTFTQPTVWTARSLSDTTPAGCAIIRVLQEHKRLAGTHTEGDTIRLWGGFGPIEIDGDTYQPLGDRGLAQQTSGALGGVANGLTLSLSGIEPDALELLNADEIKGASVVIHRLIFASDGKTLLGSEVWDRGRVDTVDTDEEIGGQATINVAVESAARGLGHSGARQRADSDQRLINPNDGYFKSTAYAGEKELYWGGKRPVRTGDAHGGVVAGSAGGTGATF